MNHSSQPTREELFHRQTLLRLLVPEAAELLSMGDDPSLDWDLDRVWSEWFERMWVALETGFPSFPSAVRFHVELEVKRAREKAELEKQQQSEQDAEELEQIELPLPAPSPIPPTP